MKMPAYKEKYKLPIVLAVLLHVFLFVFLFAHFHHTSPQPTAAQANGAQVIQATAVTSTPPPLKTQVATLEATEAATLTHSNDRTPSPTRGKVPDRADGGIKTPAPLPEKKPIVDDTQKKMAELKAAEALKLKQALAEKEAMAKQLAEERKQEALAKKEVHDALLAKQKAEKQKADKQKVEQQKAAEQKRLAAKKSAEQDLAKQLAAEEQQISQQQQKAQSAALARQMQGEVDKYKGLILQAISQHWLVPPDLRDHLSCKLLIDIAPGGMVLNVKLISGSGNAALDRSATAAVYKASPLPVPQDANAFDRFRELNLTVQPS